MDITIRFCSEDEQGKTTDEIRPPKPYMDLGDGYYFAYEERGNGYGGRCHVNVCLYKGAKLVQRITDEDGRFLDFPGVEHGEWEENLSLPFEPATRFPFSYTIFNENGLAEFIWLLQPDGRYWADEDGFGAEKMAEVKLYATFNKKGRFVTPFREKEISYD